MADIMDIDGSVLEGGGQILRIAISLSAILRQPVRVSNIRAGRKNPGLAAQHFHGIQLVGEMCGAKMKGVSIGSTEIEFWPGTIRGGHYMANAKTAASISLLVQVALPVALYADGPVTLDLKGGTNADMAPQIDYMTSVFRPMLRKFGADFDLTIHKRGYFPRGGGHVTVDISPVKQLQAVTFTEAGTLTRVEGIAVVAGAVPVKVAHMMRDGAKSQLSSETTDIDIKFYKDPEGRSDNCSAITLTLHLSSGCVIGGSEIARKREDSYEMGRRLASNLVSSYRGQACCDPHCQDQVIVYMCLAEGRCGARGGPATLHTQTAVHVAQTIAKVKFNIDGSGDDTIITCDGLGVINKNFPV